MMNDASLKNISRDALGGRDLSRPYILAHSGINKNNPGRSRLESGPGRRGGGYLLSHFRSIIGVVRFNFSVRDGKRWSPDAMAT